jgi:thiamine monophosphate kinase
VPPNKKNQVAVIAANLKIPLTAIGTIDTTKALQLRAADGMLSPLPRSGYQHF